MLGMEDGWITLVWLLCIISMFFCVIYGAIKWNHEDDSR
ncbi:symporter small accessory protein [Candidatus Contubernalis alkalaceticus]